MRFSVMFCVALLLFMMLSTSLEAEITAAVYESDDQRVQVQIESLDDVLKSSSTLNFPQIIDFDTDVLGLAHGQGAHYGGETRIVRLSRDGGKTWDPVSRTKPLGDDIQNSGLLGYMNDGTIIYINAMPEEYRPYRAGKKKLKNRQLKEEFFIADPTFRLRTFDSNANVLQDTVMKVTDTPWAKARYELYGTLVELDKGRIMAPFQVMTTLPRRMDIEKPRMAYGYMEYEWRVAIGVSDDGARTFRIIHVFNPRDAKEELIGQTGLAEPDLVRLNSGRLLCIMRTGWASAMYQAVSDDAGQTWTEPVSVGWPGVRPRLRVMSNGMLVCSAGRGPFGRVYNPEVICPGHPQSTFVLVNPDGNGEQWLSPFYFYTGPGCSYTSNTERDGKLWVYFSSSSFGKPAGTYDLPYQSIKRAVIDIRKENP